MKKYARVMLWVVLAVFWGVRCLYAQGEENQTHEVSSSVCYMPVRSFEAQPGKIGILESDFEYSYTFKASERLPVTLSLQAEHINLDESGSQMYPLPAQLTGVGLGVEATFPFFNLEKTYWRTKLIPSFNTDDWSARSSAFRIPIHTFLIYQPNATWTFVGGVAVYNDFEERIFPIFGFIYKPNDKLTVNLVPDDPHIAYAVNERVTLFAEAGSTSREFEVRKDSLRDVILRYAQMHAGAGVKFKLNKYAETSLSSGYVFNRCLKYGDSRGKFVIKNDPYCEFRVEFGI